MPDAHALASPRLGRFGKNPRSIPDDYPTMGPCGLGLLHQLAQREMPASPVCDK